MMNEERMRPMSDVCGLGECSELPYFDSALTHLGDSNSICEKNLCHMSRRFSCGRDGERNRGETYHGSLPIVGPGAVSKCLSV